jgi:hypothetical protein
LNITDSRVVYFVQYLLTPLSAFERTVAPIRASTERLKLIGFQSDTATPKWWMTGCTFQ